jgi:cytochrome c553
MLHPSNIHLRVHPGLIFRRNLRAIGQPVVISLSLKQFSRALLSLHGRRRLNMSHQHKRRYPYCIVLSLLVASIQTAFASESATDKANSVCAACHGKNGISVAEYIPNLAGQRASYLAIQLRAFKTGTRKNEVMQAVATQLSNADINSVAQHFARVSQTGATETTAANPANSPTTASGSPNARSAYLPNLAKSNVKIPADFKTKFVQYHKLNLPDSQQLKIYYANDVAINATKAGKALPDGSIILAEVFAIKIDQDKKPLLDKDGFFVPDRLLANSTMARGADWGADIPEMLRNENWNYALLSKDQNPIAVNQAECLACHKPEARSSYLFTYKSLLAYVNAQPASK